MKPSRQATRSLETRALLLRRVEYSESDLVLHLLTEATGRVAALARSARKSQKRFGGALEPFHTLRVRLEEREGKELMTLGEAVIETPRRRIVSSLERMEAAGRVFGWVRRSAPPRVREPAIWSTVTTFLEELEASSGTASIDRQLATAGLRLLAACGWGLELEQCVACGRECEVGRAAFVDAGRGGLVCRACGGARVQLGGAQRERLRDVTLSNAASLDDADTALALGLVDAAMRAHLGFE